MKKYIIILSILLASCGTTKKLEKTEVVSVEAVSTQQQLKAEPLRQVLTLRELCFPDTVEVSGPQLPPRIIKQIETKYDTVTLRVWDNEAELEYTRAEHIIQQKDSVIRNYEREISEYKQKSKRDITFYLLIAYAVIVSFFCVRLIIHR